MKHLFNILLIFHCIVAFSNPYCITNEAISARLKNLEELKTIMQNQRNDFCQDGFAFDTLVKTINGYTPIQELKPGDLIVNHNDELCAVKNVSKKLVTQYVKITFDDHVIVAGSHQLFYVGYKDQWIMAQDLALADSDSIKSIEHVDEPLLTYVITVENHIFCLGPDDLIVHNMDAAAVDAGAIYLRYIVVINPVVAIVGATLVLAKLSYDLYNVAEIKTYINQHCQDNFSISDDSNYLIERFYFNHRKSMLQNLLQEFLSILDAITTLKTGDGSFTSLFLNTKTPSCSPNQYGDISLAQEKTLGILEKENLRACRETELQALEEEIIAMQFMLAFHLNELIEQKDNAINAYSKVLEESAPLYKIWHESPNHVSQKTALELYKQLLIEEHSVHNAQSKMKELKLIIEWYKKSNKCEFLKQTSNIFAELERQMQHILAVEKHMQEEEKKINGNLAEIKKYFDKYRIMIGAFKSEIQLNLEKHQKKQHDKLLKDAKAKHKKLAPTGGPKKDDDDKNDKKSLINICEKSVQHIFRKKAGHFFPDTPNFRALIISIASKTENFLGYDQFGNSWFAQLLANGQQIWVTVRDNYIRNAGFNDLPRIFNNQTGLCQSLG